MRGSCQHPVTASGVETIVDMTLDQKSGDDVVQSDSATIAYFNGAGGGPITVRAKGTRDWQHVASPRVYGFDPVWYDETGDSGYDISFPPYNYMYIIFQ